MADNSVAVMMAVQASTKALKTAREAAAKPKGDQGEPGPQGEQGLVGPEGPQGVPGVAAPPGIQGKSGKDGTDGHSVMGPVGKEGKEGKAGTDGKAPEHRFVDGKLQFKLPNGNWGKAVDLKGKDGKDGKATTGGKGGPNFISTGGSASNNRNVGGGEGIVTTGANSFDHPFKSLVEGTNITLTATDTEITIDATGSGGIANIVEDLTPQLGANLDTQSFTVDGRDVGTDGTKLDGIESSATADQTGAEIKTAYEAETNAYTDTKNTKLAGIETAATADQTGAQIKTAYEGESDTNAFTDADETKLDGIATAATANQTDATLKARANHTGTQALNTVVTEAGLTDIETLTQVAYDALSPPTSTILYLIIG